MRPARWAARARSPASRSARARARRTVRRHLRHAGGGGAVARRVREDVQPGQAEVADRGQRVGEHPIGLGRKSGDQVGAENDVGAGAAQAIDDAGGVGARMAALHPLQHQIVRRLQAEMDVRHQPRFAGEGGDEVVVDRRRIEAGQPKPGKQWHPPQQRAHHVPKGRTVRQVRTVRADIDAGQHHLKMTGIDEAFDGCHDPIGIDAATGPTDKGDDAEGAAVIAALLHLDEGAGATLEAVDQVTGGLLQGHDVADDDRPRPR